MPTRIQLPVGRIVWGNPAKAMQKRSQETRQVVLKDGKPVDQWAFGLAIPAQAFINEVWPVMDREAKTGYPQGVPPNFAFKFKDGNGVDRQGKPYSAREGYAGHYVLNISTEAFAPQIYKFENGSYRQLQAHEIKCGDYVVVTVDFQVNVPQNRAHTPGLYVNPVGILHVGYGTEITTVADPTQIFGAAPPQFVLPPGASATPMAPTGVAPPYGGAPQPGSYQPPGMPAQPPQMPGGAPGPAPGYPQPAPGYAPQGGPVSSGPMPGNPAYGPPGMPAQPPQMPGGAPGYAPAYDFTRGAPGPAPGYPQQQPGPGMPYPPR